MSESEIKMVEFEIPVITGLQGKVAEYWAFAACVTQWLDGESVKRCPATSKQVIIHRLLTALESGPRVVWLASDWKFVCELLGSTEIDLVPTLSTKPEDENAEPQKIQPPPALTRLYLAAIFGAKPEGAVVEAPAEIAAAAE